MGEMRYVLDPNGHLHCANSSNFIHNGIKRDAFDGVDRPVGLYIQGYARWTTAVKDGEKVDRFEHWVSYTCNENEGDFHSSVDIRTKFQHPHIEKLHERGFVRTVDCF
jgi:hypothetical protein